MVFTYNVWMHPTELYTVEPSLLDEVWPSVRPLLERALSHSDGELDVFDLARLVFCGDAKLVVAVRDAVFVGAAVVEFIQYPKYRVANVIALGGKSLWAGDAETDLLKQWAKAQGAAKLQGFCRPSIVRRFRRAGFVQKYIVMRCDL